MKKLMQIVSICLLLLSGLMTKNVIASQDIKKPEDYKVRIGLSKLTSHPALDEVERGIIDEFKEQGYVNLKIDFQTANGEISTAASIANKYKSEKVSVAIGISTPMALALAGNLKGTPVVFAAVTDPFSVGLRTKDQSKQKRPVTGVVDTTPVAEQVKIIYDVIKPKKLGFIYNPSESNSIILHKMTEENCKKYGIELVTATVTNSSEVKQAAEVLAKRVQAIYVTTDNVVYSAVPSVIDSANKYKVPVITATPEKTKIFGSLMDYGINYYISGREAGKIVISILKGQKAQNIPVKEIDRDKLELIINMKVADKLGIKIPDEILKRADKVIN